MDIHESRYRRHCTLGQGKRTFVVLKLNKNDAADAAAICEAISRPTMRFVPMKTADQQASLMLVGRRDGPIRRHARAGEMPRPLLDPTPTSVC